MASSNEITWFWSKLLFFAHGTLKKCYWYTHGEWNTCSRFGDYRSLELCSSISYCCCTSQFDETVLDVLRFHITLRYMRNFFWGCTTVLPVWNESNVQIIWQGVNNHMANKHLLHRYPLFKHFIVVLTNYILVINLNITYNNVGWICCGNDEWKRKLHSRGITSFAIYGKLPFSHCHRNPRNVALNLIVYSEYISTMISYVVTSVIHETNLVVPHTTLFTTRYHDKFVTFAINLDIGRHYWLRMTDTRNHLKTWINGTPDD